MEDFDLRQLVKIPVFAIGNATGFGRVEKKNHHAQEISNHNKTLHDAYYYSILQRAEPAEPAEPVPANHAVLHSPLAGVRSFFSVHPLNCAPLQA